MSTRERWVMYPLLFMTLGIALRDKLIPPAQLGNLRTRVEAGEIAAPRIHCGELRVGRVVCERLEAKQSESIQSQCHAMIVTAANGQPVVVLGPDANTQAGTVETFTAGGVPQIRLTSTDTGGAVTTIGHSGQVTLIMGHVDQNLGIFAQLAGQKPLIQLTTPVRFEIAPAAPQPAPPAAKPAEKPKPKK